MFFVQNKIRWQKLLVAQEFCFFFCGAQSLFSIFFVHYFIFCGKHKLHFFMRCVQNWIPIHIRIEFFVIHLFWCVFELESDLIYLKHCVRAIRNCARPTCQKLNTHTSNICTLLTLHLNVYEPAKQIGIQLLLML